MMRKYWHLKRKQRALELLLIDIPGEPCGGILAHCPHPEKHERYFAANCELQDVREALWNMPVFRFWRAARAYLVGIVIGILLMALWTLFWRIYR